MSRTKFYLVLFALHCPSSLLIPLAQQNAASTSNTNSLVASGPNQNALTTPNNSNATEVIQQIDVKDGVNQVSSNINHVVVIDEKVQTDSNGTQNKGTNNLVVDNAVEQIENASSVLNSTGVPLNSTSSLLLTNLLNGSSGNTLEANNITIHGLQNKLADETQTNPLNTTDDVNVSILHESLNDVEVELAWRSDIPVGQNKTIFFKHIAKSQNATLLANNINGNKNNSKSELLDSDNDEEKSIFVILNSGKIDGLSVNSPANNGKLQTNLEHNAIENLNSRHSKLLNNFINSTINDVLSKILQLNHSNLNSTNLFLLVNSGNISNVHVSSPILENVKNTTLKDRSRRYLNETYTNNTSVESVTLKSSSDKSNSIIDVKFRTGEYQGLQNNVTIDNHTVTIPLYSNQNNTTLGSNVPDNNTLANFDATSAEIPTEDISSAEAPAFRSLIPDKIRKLQKVSNVVSNLINKTVDHNLVLKLSPESPPLSIDLDQIPINNLLGGAMSLLKRLKRNTNDKAESSYPRKTNCKSKQIDEHHTVTSCNKSKLMNNNDLTTQTRRSFNNDTSDVLKLDSLDLICPLSVIVKLYTNQVLDNLAKNDPDGVLNKILTSFLEGNKDAIELVSTEILHLPTPIKIRLQLVHGKTKEFMEQLSDIVDATLCSMS